MMKKLPLFDLHCDTLLACYKTHQSIYQNNLHIDLLRGKSFSPWVQTFAFFIEDAYTMPQAFSLFSQLYRYFVAQYHLHQQHICFYQPQQYDSTKRNQWLLSVENGSLLEEDLARVSLLKQLGISILTLVWNGRNQIGSGFSHPQQGLTSFGKQLIQILEQENILIDVSHLNDVGFLDVARLSKKPFLSSHSNVRHLCPHTRNLTDEQILVLIERKGLIGINFYPLFVSGTDDYSSKQLIAHMEHILRLGGTDVLSIGSDFDGAFMPSFLSDIKKIDLLRQDMINYFGDSITQKVFFENAHHFFTKNLVVTNIEPSIHSGAFAQLAPSNMNGVFKGE